MEKRIRLPQDKDTPLTTTDTAFGTVLYLYARAGDSVHAETTGQDYVAFQHDKSNLAFAVCDGVGQSFLGELAAQILGDFLCDWLWQLNEKPESAEDFAQRVTAALDEKTTMAAKQVAAYTLPDELPPILKQALEMQRAYGSESMFVAARIALRGPEPWVALCWLGDSPVAAIDFEGDLVDLGPRGSTAERWNANTGVKGTVHAWVGSATDVARVAGYTDGLAVDSVPTDKDIAHLMERWPDDPPSDDASLVDVRLAVSPKTVEADADDSDRLKQFVFVPDPDRPLPTPEDLQTPVASVKPIEAEKTDKTPTGEWRPLSQKTVDETGEDRMEQIKVWQQAAMEGLISATLALERIDRLLKEKER